MDLGLETCVLRHDLLLPLLMRFVLLVLKGCLIFRIFFFVLYDICRFHRGHENFFLVSDVFDLFLFFAFQLLLELLSEAFVYGWLVRTWQGHSLPVLPLLLTLVKLLLVSELAILALFFLDAFFYLLLLQGSVASFFL